MSLKIVASNRFKKDLKLAIKSNINIDRINNVITMLAEGVPLPEKYYDHNLTGDYSGFEECHIESDWLLV